MMIEYLSVVATILLLLHIWGFLGNFKRWSDFNDNMNANAQTIRQKLELLNVRLEDMKSRANNENFEVVLSNSNVPLSLPLPSLVKDALNEKINTIITWLLVDASTRIIGVHGIEGIGKTTLISCLYNLLIEQYEDKYDTIILIECKSNNETELRLQEQIANELKINLEQANNDPLRRRAAVLHRVLSKKKFVLILDGLTKPISDPTTIGIPLGENGKMIITSRSLVVCRRTGCSTDKTIGMLPLSKDDAFKLFKEKVKVDFVSNPDLEPLAKKLVERCGFVPSKIVDIAGELIGDDVIENWKAHFSNRSMTG